MGDIELMTSGFVVAAAANSDAAVRQIVGPEMLSIIAGGIQQRPRFEHHNIETALGQDLRRHATSGARSYDADVIYLRRTRNLKHQDLAAPIHRTAFSRILIGISCL